MASSTTTIRTCSKGHQYHKNSDCPTCPVCERDRKPKSGFLSLLAAPARRALENNQIISLKQLSTYTEKEIISLHGIGPAALPILKKSLQSEGLSFTKQKK
ncbi:RNA polymerase alpha subunit C-terminal domain-containing protein [Ferruginibacter lapsinanis]|uniref:RNA polymerase alpha subunit C-terminal domain-containing protein n=1 Tax=Ferruginibacter lapsinanis TaxID=563172 RepID=UPI001E5E742E|nr:RNA polymerase alpha subunit C-terminal domain-containing protein [Ferruginibacter lapsinanis]UEG49608.1 RNA polymerase alpha subunit C-terminal domain-containing protein [Ferruginibacter lapsinanis]